MLKLKKKDIPSYLLIFFLALWAFYIIYSAPRYENNEYYRRNAPLYSFVARHGKLNTEFNDLISQIKKDFTGTNSIETAEFEVYIGFFNSTITETAVMTDISDTKYIIIIDDDFYMRLDQDEKKALIGHEVGHMLQPFYKLHMADNRIDSQIMADTVAARYAGPDAVMSLLNKDPNLRQRVENLQKIKNQGQ